MDSTCRSLEALHFPSLAPLIDVVSDVEKDKAQQIASLGRQM